MARSKCMQIKIFLRSYLFLFRVIRVKDQAVENSDPASYLCYCGLNMYSDFKVSALFLIFVTCIFTWHGEGILILFIVADKNLEKHCNAAIKLHHRVCIYIPTVYVKIKTNIQCTHLISRDIIIYGLLRK